MIRPALARELEFLSELAMRSKAVWGYTPEFMAQCREELTLTDEELPGVYVKDTASMIVGFYSLQHLSNDRAELGHLFVEPTEMRKGYGMELIQDAMGRARSAGYRTLVIQGDPHAAAFYVAAGASRVGERPSASIPGRMLPLFEAAV
jgi:GNAT superfamily N-acetyltransferase